MQIFLAGNTQLQDREREVLHLHGSRLRNYWGAPDDRAFWKTLHLFRENREMELFIDSGAFSAWNSGSVIELDEYMQFLQEHEDVIDVYANLDVIGDPVATMQNQKRMEAEGFSPLPCFHQGEPMRYLKYYLKNYDYIALGGMVNLTSAVRAMWLDEVFGNYICDGEGVPRVKVHGYGMTSFVLLFRYPWYSVDSTSWVVAARTGQIILPPLKSGRWQYLVPPWKVTVSNRSPKSRDVGSWHIDTMSPTVKEAVLGLIAERGFVMGHSSFVEKPVSYKPQENERWLDPPVPKGTRTLEVLEERGLCNDYKHRDRFNVLYYSELEKHIPEWPWAFVSRDSGLGL